MAKNKIGITLIDNEFNMLFRDVFQTLLVWFEWVFMVY